MEIRNINNTPRFTGIYKIPNVDTKTIENISSHMTFFARVTNRPVYLFGGNYPLQDSVVKIINESVPECSRYSYDWLVQNAQRHGVKLPASDIFDVWIFTNKDIDLVKNYLKQSSSIVNKKRTLWSAIKSLFTAPNTSEMELPSHLRGLQRFLAVNNTLTNIFQNIVSKEKVVEVNSVEKLIMTMFQEG